MPKNSLVPGAKRFEFKNGFDNLRWGGMATEGDPSAIARNQFRLLLNALVVNGEVQDRPGSSKLNAAALNTSSACVCHLADFQLKKALRLWMIGDGCPGSSASLGFYVAHYDDDQNPAFQRAVYYDRETSQVVFESYDSYIYLGTDSALRRLQLVKVEYGTENIAVSGKDQATPVYTFAGFQIKALRTFDGKLFVGLDGGAGASKIAVWDTVTSHDGTQGTTADLTGINQPTALGLWRDNLVLGFGSASNQIRLRDLGSVPGTWTTVTPGAGTVSSVDFVSHEDVLYIASGSTDVWSYDGTTLASARSIAGATIRAVASFNGFLYVGYETATEARIARYDGTSWVDTHKNITTQFSSARSVRDMVEYRGSLVAGGTGTAGGQLWFSNGVDTANATGWTQTTPNASSNGDLDFLLVA